MDYSLLRRAEFPARMVNSLPTWDLFLSAYNKSERVNTLFSAVRSARKEWLIHPEYDFDPTELPKDSVVHALSSRDEADFWHEYFVEADFDRLSQDARICV